MDILQLLAEALDIARQLGFEIREECLPNEGGACRIRGCKYLFLDARLAARERLERVLNAIRGDTGLAQLSIRPALKHLLAQP